MVAVRLRGLICVLLLCAPLAWARPPDDDSGLTRIGRWRTSETLSLISRGSAQVVTDETNTEGITVSSVVIGHTGSALLASLVYACADMSAASRVSSVTWGGTPLTRVLRKWKVPQDAGADFPSSAEIWYLANATAGTHDVVVVMVLDGSLQGVDALVVCCDEAVGVAVTPLDDSAGAVGETNSASSGIPAGQSQNHNLLYGAIAKREVVTRSIGSWSNGFSVSTRDGTNFGDEAFDYTLATGSRTINAPAAVVAAEKIGFETASDWNALLVVLKAL